MLLGINSGPISESVSDSLFMDTSSTSHSSSSAWESLIKSSEGNRNVGVEASTKKFSSSDGVL